MHVYRHFLKNKHVWTNLLQNKSLTLFHTRFCFTLLQPDFNSQPGFSSFSKISDRCHKTFKLWLSLPCTCWTPCPVSSHRSPLCLMFSIKEYFWFYPWIWQVPLCILAVWLWQLDFHFSVHVNKLQQHALRPSHTARTWSMDHSSSFFCKLWNDFCQFDRKI